MKKLLKSVICGSMNSTQKHCSLKTWSTTTAWKKKKKKRRKKKRGHAIQTLTICDVGTQKTHHYQPKVEVLKYKKLLI